MTFQQTRQFIIRKVKKRRANGLLRLFNDLTRVRYDEERDIFLVQPTKPVDHIDISANIRPESAENCLLTPVAFKAMLDFDGRHNDE